MEVLRYAAFSADPHGGNPAGVVLDAAGATDGDMLATAAEVGFSETAFLTPVASRQFAVRYFSPLAEVPFCGHATIGSAVAFAERHGGGPVRYDTSVGRVDIRTGRDPNGALQATLVSVMPAVAPLDGADRAELLAALRWAPEDLDPALPTRVAYGGAYHPIVAARTDDRLRDLDYDYPRLATLMAARDWTTVDLVHRVDPTTFRARNPFPPGGVVEDPVTGAAAAAFGGYLRSLGLVDLPATVTVHQGEEVGRPGHITVDIPAEPRSGIAVTGTAVAMDG